jgi:hypothetical protein
MPVDIAVASGGTSGSTGNINLSIGTLAVAAGCLRLLQRRACDTGQQPTTGDHGAPWQFCDASLVHSHLTFQACTSRLPVSWT